MKKLISIILSLALVACMFGMSAMAADILEQPVGKHNGGNGVDDGWTDTQFNSDKSATADVTLTLGAVQSRYAVDITFGGNYNLGVSGLVWDVNNLKYVWAGAADTATISSDLAYTFEVVNYSDNDITVSATYAPGAAFTEAGLNAAFWAQDTASFTSTGNETNVTGTLKGNVSGTARADVSKVAFGAGITSADWEGAINKLVEAGYSNKFTLATFTVTVAKVS